MYFFLETGKRYRPNSSFIVIYGKFVRGWTFFRIRSRPMTSSLYPVHVNSRIFKIEKTSHVIHHSTPKTLESSFLALLISLSSVVAAKVIVFEFYNHRENTWEILITSSWRNRKWPDSEKSSAPYKFFIDYDKKRIKSISLTSFE